MRVWCILAVVLSLAVPAARAQTGGWEFPTTAAVTVGAADNNKILATDNVPGGAVTVTLPNPATVGASWNMGFRTASGKGIIVNAPNSVYILAGQKQMTSFSAPSDDNYEFFTLQSDGTNFQLTNASGKPQLYNGIVGAEGAQQWTYIPVTGYSATQADNGTVLASPQAGGDVTVTLPSAPLLHNAWAIRLSAWHANSITVQVNPVQGGEIFTPAGFGTTQVSSFTVPPRSAALLSFSGTAFYISMYAGNAVPVADDLTALQATGTPSAPFGIWRLTYSNPTAPGTFSQAPPLFYIPLSIPCTINAGAGDGGVQVASLDGLCWFAKFPVGPLDVRQWGADPNSTDNYPAIAAALAFAAAKCETIGFPKAHLHVNSQLAVPDCVGMVGAGRDGNLNLTGQGTILDFSGLPPATTAIIAGTAANVSSAIEIANMQIQSATGDCLDVAVDTSNIHELNLLSCAGVGLAINATARTRYHDIVANGNGNHGITLNGDPTSNGANIGTSTFENVSSQNNTLAGYFLNYANTTTFIGSLAKLNGSQGFAVHNSHTLTMVGTYAKTNGRVGYLFDATDGTLMGARAETNNTTHTGSGDFIVATNGSSIGVFYGSDDIAPSGTSIFSSAGATVHVFGTLTAGLRTADASSIIDKFMTGFNGTSLSFGGAALAAGQCTSQDTTLSNVRAALADTAAASPLTYPGDGFFWQAYVPADNTVRIKLCAAVAGTPAVSAYNIRVLQ